MSRTVTCFSSQSVVGFDKKSPRLIGAGWSFVCTVPVSTRFGPWQIPRKVQMDHLTGRDAASLFVSAPVNTQHRQENDIGYTKCSRHGGSPKSHIHNEVREHIGYTKCSHGHGASPKSHVIGELSLGLQEILVIGEKGSPKPHVGAKNVP